MAFESKDFEDSKYASNVNVGSDLPPSESSEKVQLRKKREREEAAFDISEDPRYYKPIPTYEGIHRWDPDFEWTEEEEKKIVRKVRFFTLLFFLFFFYFYFYFFFLCTSN